jgi:hypothetical protein
LRSDASSSREFEWRRFRAVEIRKREVEPLKWLGGNGKMERFLCGSKTPMPQFRLCPASIVN